MSINGNILIDKIRITFSAEVLSEIEHTTESYIEKVREIARIVWFHLTKNVIVNEPVPLYIKFLSNFPFARGYKPAYIYSSEDNSTLRIATQKHNTEKSDVSGDRMIIFYEGST